MSVAGDKSNRIPSIPAHKSAKRRAYKRLFSKEISLHDAWSKYIQSCVLLYIFCLHPARGRKNASHHICLNKNAIVAFFCCGLLNMALPMQSLHLPSHASVTIIQHTHGKLALIGNNMDLLYIVLISWADNSAAVTRQPFMSSETMLLLSNRFEGISIDFLFPRNPTSIPLINCAYLLIITDADMREYKGAKWDTLTHHIVYKCLLPGHPHRFYVVQWSPGSFWLGRSPLSHR